MNRAITIHEISSLLTNQIEIKGWTILMHQFGTDQNSNNFFSIFPDLKIVSELATKLSKANGLNLVSLKEKHTVFAFLKMDYLASTILQQLKTKNA